MANNKYMTDDKLRKSKSDDLVPYKVMLALILLCVALFSLSKFRSYFVSKEAIDSLFDLYPTFAIAGLGLFAVSGIVLLLLRKFRAARFICPWFMALGALVALTFSAIQLTWDEDFDLIYFICVAALVQYVVFQLYRWEFFLVSMPTVASVVLFYGIKGGFVFNLRNSFLLAVCLLLIGFSALCAFLASRNHGLLSFGRTRCKVFGSKGSPMPVYLIAALWVFCIALILLLSIVSSLSGLFAYYCMFAAIAVEFIAAVYYTFQLN